jgi:hypothetical protein
LTVTTLARSRGSLVALVVLVASLELAIKRVAMPLLHVNLWAPRSVLRRVLDTAGHFSFELLSVLALAVLLTGILFVTLRGTEFRPASRLAFPLVGLVFVALAAIAVVRRTTPQLHAHLRLTYVFLTLLFVMAALATRSAGRMKLGTVLIWGGVLLSLWPRMIMGLPLPFEVTPDGADAMTLASLACFVLGGAALSPTGKTGRPMFAAGLALLVMVCGGIIIVVDWDTGRTLAHDAWGVELPMTRWGQLLALLALGSMVQATMRLILTPGVQRLRGIGIALISLGGVALEMPGQLATSALGFLCIAASAARVDAAPMPWELFEALVRKVAVAVGAPTVTLTGPRGAETVAAHAPATGTPMSVRLERQAGAVAAVEISVGETPSREPPLVIADKSARRLGPRRSEPPAPTGDAEFDERFVVQDPRGAGVPLLDEQTRKRLHALATGGWLGIWPDRALVYRSARLPDGEDGLVSLVGLLRELAAPRNIAS